MQTTTKKRSRIFIIGIVIVILCGMSIWYYVQSKHNHEIQLQQQQKIQQETAIRKKIWLNDWNGSSAPNFTLQDQNGKSISMSDFKGKAVVLQFIDPECTDICPIVSQEVLDANKLLKDKSAQVEYIGVNVNQYHASRDDILQYSKEHRLQTLSNWHFVTGNTDQLQKIWKNYGIDVVPTPTGDVQHSSFIYFIDPQGKERYIANPDNSKASIPDWATGIAYFTNKLL